MMKVQLTQKQIFIFGLVLCVGGLFGMVSGLSNMAGYLFISGVMMVFLLTLYKLVLVLKGKLVLVLKGKEKLGLF